MLPPTLQSLQPGMIPHIVRMRIDVKALLKLMILNSSSGGQTGKLLGKAIFACQKEGLDRSFTLIEEKRKETLVLAKLDLEEEK